MYRLFCGFKLVRCKASFCVFELRAGFWLSEYFLTQNAPQKKSDRNITTLQICETLGPDFSSTLSFGVISFIAFFMALHSALPVSFSAIAHELHHSKVKAAKNCIILDHIQPQQTINISEHQHHLCTSYHITTNVYSGILVQFRSRFKQ